MTRVQGCVGMVLAGLLLGMGTPEARERGHESCVECKVEFRFGAGPEGSWLTATSNGTTLQKRVGPSGLSIELSAQGDIVRVTAASSGSVTVERDGSLVTVQPDAVLADYAESVSRLLRQSAAVEGLERMVQSLRYSERPEAMSVTATFALLRSLHGDSTGNTLLSQRVERRRRVSLATAAQNSRDGTSVVDCWLEYERSLNWSFERYSRCLRDYWWNQPVQYACGLEFAMVAELALFRVISCSGGFPIG